jgi:hypothetical protein
MEVAPQDWSVKNGNPESARTLTEEPYLSFVELARRWRVSRATVYNRLRALGAEVLDFAPPGKKGRKVIALSVVLQIEQRRMRRLR